MPKTDKPSPEDEAKLKAEQAKMHAKMEKERQKAAKKRTKDREKQAKDAERYEKQAAEARKKAVEARAEHEAKAQDPKYQAKKLKEEERLKAQGKKQIEKMRKQSAKKADKAAKTKAKVEKKHAAESEGLQGKARKRRGAKSNESGLASTNAGKKARQNTPKRKKGSVICLVAMLAVLIASVIMLWPPQDKITMGLDIQGGLSVNLQASTEDGSAVTSDEMSEAQKVITTRVNASGASAASVQQQGNNAFLVQVPGASNSQEILDTLSSQGVLEFVRVDQIKSKKVQQYIEQGITGMNLKDNNIKYTAFMTGDNVTQTTVSRPQGSADYAVDLQLDSTGTSEFASVTKDLVSSKGQIAILLDGVVKSAPAVQSAITNGQVEITGSYTSEEANSLKSIIDSGSLPVTLTIQQSSTVGPTIGNSALWVGIESAGVGLALVIIWLLLFYDGLGLLTGVSIIIMSTVYLGLLAALSAAGMFSLTLPGIAGIIVNIGMAADSSILIMECFHEQIRIGRSVKAAAKTGVHEGIFTSVDADVVTLVSALVLYFFAMGDVRGFGLTLALGIMCDLLIMALFSGPIIRLLGPGVIARHPGFWGIRDEVNQGNSVSKEAK